MNIRVSGIVRIAAVLTTQSLLAILASPGAYGQVSFFTPPTYAGSGTLFVADFNGDGKPDMLSSDGTLQLGKGDGTFATGTTVAGAPLAVADVNGDRKADVLEQGTGTLIVLLGNGDGTFQAGISTPSGANLTAIAASDLKQSGRADVVGVSGSTLLIYLSKGDGTFAPATIYDLGAASAGGTTIVFGDLNNDGKTDIAVMIAGDNVPGQEIVFLGNGDGTFQASESSAGILYPGSAVIDDFNGDGKLDIAVSGSLSSRGISVLLGNGDGTFQPPNPVLSSGSGTLVAADANGDGKPDLIVNNYPLLQVYLGDGDGTFSTTYSYTLSLVSASLGVAVADFNLDGKLDVAAGNYVLLGRGNGTFQGRPAAPLPSSASAAVTADFDNNGTQDVASISVNNLNNLYVLLNDGSGALTLAYTYSLQQPSYAIASADLNGDGNLDLVVGGADPVTQNWSYSVLLGKGDGSFMPPVFHPQTVFGPGAMVVADFNNDHKTDIVLSLPGSSNQALAVLLGNGDGTFGAPVYVFDGGGRALVAADFNSDGKLDLAAAGASGLAVLFGDGDGTFQPAIFPSTQSYNDLFTADLNGDGKADLITDGQVFLANGAGGFSFITQSQILAVDALADLNGDGKTDVIGIHRVGSHSDCCGVYLGNGDGTFGPYLDIIDFGGPFSPNLESFVTTADMNHDGRPDLVLGEASGSPGVFVLLNTTAVGIPGTLGLSIAAGSSSSATVQAGAPAKYMLTIGGAGFSGQTSLTCTGAPVDASCSVAPSSLMISATTAADLTVSVSTSAATSASLQQHNVPLFWGLTVVAFGLAILPAMSFATKSRIRFSLISAVLLLAPLVSSCGGGGDSRKAAAGTPAGTYPLTVTAQSGSMTQSTTLTLVVH